MEYKFLSHYVGAEFNFDCTDTGNGNYEFADDASGDIICVEVTFDGTDNTITADNGGIIEVTESDANGNVLAFVYNGDTFTAEI